VRAKFKTQENLMPLKVRSKKKGTWSTTDSHLMVKSHADYEISEWDGDKIINALVEECGIGRREARQIQKEVHAEFRELGKSEVDVQAVKSFVNYHLAKNGHNGPILQGQLPIGMSLYDLRNLIKDKSAENSNVSSNNPEAISSTISEHTLKQFALKEVFSQEVSRAHLQGRIHLHDLGAINKVYCSAHSLRSIAMLGLGKYFMSDTKSTPASHAMTLVGHLNTFLCSMAHYYAGALGVDFVNIYFAPYVHEMEYKEMRQIAQYLIFSLSQSAFSRGGQVLFTDFNVHMTVPKWLRLVQAIGPKGKLLRKIQYKIPSHLKSQAGDLTYVSYDEGDPTIRKFFDHEDTLEDIYKAADENKLGLCWIPKTYADFEETAQEFLKAMMDVWREGDSNGMPFAFPKFDLHLSQEDFDNEKADELLDHACKISSENGSPYFVFDRDSTMLAACCRLRTKLKVCLFGEPERIRFCGFQNVTLNFPQCAYKAVGKNPENPIEQFYEELDEVLDLAIKAHFQKRKYIEEIGKDPGDPMYDLLSREYFDGDPYINLDEATYIIGLIGITDAVKVLTGFDIHDNKESYDLGYEMICHLYGRVLEKSEEHGLKFSLEESPAESAARRLALVDVERYQEASEVVNGDLSNGNIYYTNSIHYRPDADINFIDRVEGQSAFHELIDSGAIVHMFCGENLPSPGSLKNLLLKVYHNTDCAQLTVSPEFTSCNDCAHRSYGLQSKCDKCGSTNVDQMTRIVGYYSKLANWNDSKKEERIAREKGKEKGDYIV